MMNTGFTIWFTGLSGSGKSTLSEVIEQRMKALGRNVEVLDGDIVRTHLSKGLGFSREDRDTNIKRIGFVCNLLTRNGVICISAAIAPYREARAWARQEIGNFMEVYVKCPIEVCRQRDVKGLYKLVDEGKITGFTGVDDKGQPIPNEQKEPSRDGRLVAPNESGLTNYRSPSVDTAAGLFIEALRIFTTLEELGYLVPEVQPAIAATAGSL